VKTLATLFTGGGCFEAGAIQAGLAPVWGVERDSRIASAYCHNFGGHCIVSRVEEVDFSLLARPDWLHMSPVCTNASVAKRDGGETEEDREMARACARAIEALRPDEISLENVYGYRNFDSFGIIVEALKRNGYRFDFWHLNAADYGVPQTRKRLILLASKTHRPHRPRATHREGGDMFLSPWAGWYQAIEDLIPTLPASKFAEWQLKRLPEAVARGVLIDGRNTNQQFGKLHRTDDEPSITVTSDNRPSHMARAFVMDDQRNGFNDGGRVPHSAAPIFSLTTRPASKTRAFIVDGKPSNYEGDELKLFDGESPVGTLTATQTRHPFRAFVAHPSADNERFVVRTDDEPTFTQTNTAGVQRAFLVGGANTSDEQSGAGVGVSDAREPSRCVNATNSAHWRAWLSEGRVVRMTPRALARFQSLPDEYILPDSGSLSSSIIGNGVPSLLARRIVESVREGRR
jgi:site-specific DNA-cytosine methylase